MRLVVFICLLLLALASMGRGQAFLPLHVAFGDRAHFTDIMRFRLALNMRPCAEVTCAKPDQAVNYCGLAGADPCQTDLWANFTVELTLPYACCASSDTTCQTPHYKGKFVVNFPRIYLVGKNGSCSPVPATTELSWQTSNDTLVPADQLCAPDCFFMPLFAPSNWSDGALAAVQIVEGNNPSLPLYAYLAVAVTGRNDTPPLLSSKYIAGPTPGVLPSPVNCTFPERDPPVVPNLGCNKTCGCWTVALLARDLLWNGPVVTSVYTFKLISDCSRDYMPAYLSFCEPTGASGVLLESDALTVGKTGSKCQYTTANGSCSPLAPCQSRCWVAQMDTCKWKERKADLFYVTMVGASDELSFQFYTSVPDSDHVQFVSIESRDCFVVAVSTALDAECPISSRTYGKDCAQCLFPKTDTATEVAYCVPIDGGGYQWVLTRVTEALPNGAFLPSSADPATGFLTDCACKKILRECTPDCNLGGGTPLNCVCNTSSGECRNDAICAVQPPPGACSDKPCPSGPQGECNGNGACVCGVCKCTINNAVSWSGTACTEPDDCSLNKNCAACSLALAGNTSNCSWCQFGTGGLCISSDTCANIGGLTWSCDGSLLVSAQECPSECTCNGIKRGDCEFREGISQCICKKGYFGANCCQGKAKNSNEVTGGIVGGVIAAIVIACIVALFATGYGVKLGLHWARFRKIVAAAKNNPLYQDDPPAGGAAPTAAGAATERDGASGAESAAPSEAPSEADKLEEASAASVSVEDGISLSKQAEPPA